jgi:hypothetical protein
VLSCKPSEKGPGKDKEPLPRERTDTIPSEPTPRVVQEDTVLKKIVAFYQSDFDALTKETTLISLQQDRKELSKEKYQNTKIINNKINDLEKYHQAKQPLAKKYNEREIANAVSLLQTLNETGKEVENLIVLLENYVYAKEHLSDIVLRLNTMHLDRIRTEIERFRTNDGVDAKTYSYLNSICERILAMNRETINEKRLELLNEL